MKMAAATATIDSPPAPPPWSLHGDASALIFRDGVLAFLRYADSNVGAYDELLWLEPFKMGAGGRRHRTTRVFVSTERSAHCGRENWGPPKELAVFGVAPSGSNSAQVGVKCRDQHVVSFTVDWSQSALPVDIGILPRRARTLVQVCAGRCFEMVPHLRGRLHLARFGDLTVNAHLLPGTHEPVEARLLPARVGAARSRAKGLGHDLNDNGALIRLDRPIGAAARIDVEDARANVVEPQLACELQRMLYGLQEDAVSRGGHILVLHGSWSGEPFSLCRF
jgi:hypothetical protein